MKAFSTKNVFLSLTTLFFPIFAGSFSGEWLRPEGTTL